MKWKLLAICLVLIGLLASVGLVSAEDSVSWRSYDVVVDIREDGSIHVTETMVIEFNGSFSQGHASIPMDRIDAIENVQVATGDESGATSPARFTAVKKGNDFEIDYDIEPTRGKSVRTVVLEYDALGVIRAYPDNDPPREEIRWTAISSEVTAIGSIRSASATINFPQSVEGSDATRFDPKPASSTATSVTWKRSSMGEGDSLKTFASFPDMTEAVAPSWQADADKYESRQEVAPGLSIVTGIVAAVGFGFLSLAMWRNGVREPQVGLVADILPEPPDDLPAGLVGALVNESFGDKDVMGMLLDLDRRGILQLSEDPGSKRNKLDDPTRFHIRLMQRLEESPAWATPMLIGLFDKDPEPGDSVTFAALKTLAEHSKGKMAAAVEKVLFERGLFDELPGDSRKRWLLRAVLGLVVAAIPIAGIALWTMQFSGWLIGLSVAIGVMFTGTALLSTMTARKSMAGAEAAAKWKAFGRYLKQMEKEMEPSDRLALFDRYLPWATALGFDQASWKKWMEDTDYRWGTQQYRPWDPEWQRRYGHDYDRRYGHDHRYGHGDERRRLTTASHDGGGVSFDPQAMSDRSMAGVQTANLSMFALLNSASGTFNSGSSSSGSGSGSASSGSSGGGSRSFS